MKKLASAFLLACLACSAAAQPPVVPIDPERYEAAEEDSGIIEAVSYEGPAVRVNGRTYAFDPLAYVEIRGVRGAPTLLVPGMNVYLRFLMPNGRREIIFLRQVADSAETMAR